MTEHRFAVLLFFFFLSGCDIADEAKRANELVNTSNEIQTKILKETELMRELTEKMTKGVHEQSLIICLQQLLAAENTKILNPPFRMMPYAQCFGAEASGTELISAIDVLFQEVKLGPPEMSEYRITSLVALSALAGLAPESRSEEILRKEVEGQGLYEEAALVMGTLRYTFVRDYLLGGILDTGLVFNVPILEKAVEYFESLKTLAGKSYVERLEVKIPSLGVEVEVVPTEIGPLGRKAQRRFKEKLSSETLEIPEVKELLARLTA